jgi:anti-anti-sigma factor
MMNITKRNTDETTCVISLDGTLNARSADQVKDTFRQVVGEGVRRVVLDLSSVPFIDSSEKNGSLKLASLQSQADLLFKLTMFDKVFEIFADVDAALASYSA